MFRAGANALITGNYPTTPDVDSAKDRAMISNLGLDLTTNPEDEPRRLSSKLEYSALDGVSPSASGIGGQNARPSHRPKRELQNERN